jgi:hypothetical protein
MMKYTYNGKEYAIVLLSEQVIILFQYYGRPLDACIDTMMATPSNGTMCMIFLILLFKVMNKGEMFSISH